MRASHYATPGLILALLVSSTCSTTVGGETTNEHGHAERVGSLFATKTPYKSRLSLPPEAGAKRWSLYDIPSDLKPVLVDATLRHGTRFPSAKNVNAWKDVVSKFQRHFTSNWTLKSFPRNCSYRLSSVGWKEHLELGFRYYDMMPTLWQAIFENRKDNLHVLTSTKIRSQASARAFVTSLQHAVKQLNRDSNDTSMAFDEELVSDGIVVKNNTILFGNLTVKVNDTILRYFDHCPKYQRTAAKKEAGLEFNTLLESAVFEDQQIRRLVPFLTGKEIYQLYQICAFEMAIRGKSLWCGLFVKDDLRILEYASDVKHYYKTGPGYPINYKQACILLGDVMSNIRSREADSPKAVLRFGHAETLIPLTTLLGLNDQHIRLNASNYKENKNRTFRTGRISPFAGNIAITLYESTKNGSLYFSWVLNEFVVKPFGLDCHICKFDTTWNALVEVFKSTKCHLACQDPKDEL